MRITSSAFWEGQTIPERYTCDGSDLIPPLDLPINATKTDLERAMEGHILEHAQLMGRYDRKKKQVRGDIRHPVFPLEPRPSRD